MKAQLLALALAAATSASAQPAEQPTPALNISGERMAKDVQTLSSDAFEGRGVASAAEPKVIDYVTRQLAAAGVQPAGDPLPGGGRAWTQDVPLVRFQIRGPMTASVEGAGPALSLKQDEQIAVRAAQTGATHVAIAHAPLVFVGYGVTAPERDWDDFKGLDLRGKVILVLVNDPDFETGQGDFGGKAMTYYGRWTYKYEEAARRGAAGVLVIHETAPAAYGWATVKNSNTGPIFDIVRPEPSKTHPTLEAWVARDTAVELFRRAGLDFEAQKRAAQRRDFKPVVLEGENFSADYDVDVQKVVSHNIAGALAGRGHPDERVIYTAHWDHFGIGAPDARGDRIYNGAVDNATGVAGLLELARAFTAAPRTDRTVMFLSVTAEEQGLLGSEYYAVHPLYPLATTVADLNMDALPPIAPARDVATAGDGRLTLQDDLIAAAKDQGRRFSPDPDPEAGHFFRSDHFSFAKHGLPAISVGSGRDLAEGGTAAGEAAHQDFYRNRYHQPADEYDPKTWRMDGIAQDVSLLYDLGRRLAQSREWPTWKPGSEFKAERDKTEDVRAKLGS